MYFTFLEHKRIKQASPRPKDEEEGEILSKELEEAKEEEARPPSCSASANDEKKDKEENSGVQSVFKMFSEKVWATMRAQSIE